MALRKTEPETAVDRPRTILVHFNVRCSEHDGVTPEQVAKFLDDAVLVAADADTAVTGWPFTCPGVRIDVAFAEEV